MSFLSLLDRWDEHQAAEDDPYKCVKQLTIGASLAFGHVDKNASLSTLAELVRERCTRPGSFYSAAMPSDYDFRSDCNVLTFRSGIETESPGNNVVNAYVQESRRRHSAVVILPHWSAPDRSYRRLSALLSNLGLTAIELTLPYHGSRGQPAAKVADQFLSANLGLTIRSVRQAVVDTRGVLDWLSEQGYAHFGVIGFSLGSCIAGLVAAHDARVRGSALILTAGDFAEVVWTGRATRHIRQSLDPTIGLDQLRSVWSIISTGTFATALSRSGHSTLIVSATRDSVVKAYLTQSFVEQLRALRADIRWTTLNCGHYSGVLFPYNVLIFASLVRFLYKSGLMK